MNGVPPGPRFNLGMVVATPNALAHVPPEEIRQALARHQEGDWGEIEEEDRQQNERGVAEKRRLFSAYRSANGVRFWIITEADRSATTVLLPKDY